MATRGLDDWMLPPEEYGGTTRADAYRMGRLADMSTYGEAPPDAWSRADRERRAKDPLIPRETIDPTTLAPDIQRKMFVEDMGRQMLRRPGQLAPGRGQLSAPGAVDEQLGAVGREAVSFGIPTSVPDAASRVVFGPVGGRALRTGAGVIGGLAEMLSPAEAKDRSTSAVDLTLGKLLKPRKEPYNVENWLPVSPKPSFDSALRVANPGIYKDPRAIAREAEAVVAPEHPALKELFGVTRDDLYEIGGRGTRQGNIDPQIWMPGKPGKPNYAAEQAMNPANAQRMINALGEAQTHAPNLVKGMDAWYVMDPMYQQMVRLVGPEAAKREYMKFNAIVPPFSAGSDVMTEINRGTTANMFATKGDYDTFRALGGTAEANRGGPRSNFPNDMRDTKGHAYHAVQADPVARWLATGSHGYGNDTVKIPLYMGASGVPEVGFQTRLPVPDAHFTRAAGIPDVRRNKNFNDYMGGSEYRPFGAWYRENVAKPLGIEAVPAQARMWGTFAPQTGVETAIGAPKLELISEAIWDRAKRLGIDPKVLRDQVLLGNEHAIGLLTAGGLGTLGAAKMGGLADQSNYKQ